MTAQGRAESAREEDMESPDTRGADVIKALGSESMFIAPALPTVTKTLRCVV